MTTINSKYSGRFLPAVNIGDPVFVDDALCRISVFGINLKISSPCDGSISKMFPETGSDVRRGDPLFEIMEASQGGPAVAATAGGTATTREGG